MSDIQSNLQPSITSSRILPDGVAGQIARSTPFKETAALRDKIKDTTPIQVLTTEPVYDPPPQPKTPLSADQSLVYEDRLYGYEHFIETSGIIQQIAPNTTVVALPEDDKNALNSALDNQTLNKFFEKIGAAKTPLLTMLNNEHDDALTNTQLYLNAAKQNHINIINDSTGQDIMGLMELIDIYLIDYARLKSNKLDQKTLKARYETAKKLTDFIENLLAELKDSTSGQAINSGYVPQLLRDNVLQKMDEYIKTDNKLLQTQANTANLINEAKKEGILWIQAAGNNGNIYPKPKTGNPVDQLGFDQRIPSAKITIGSSSEGGNGPTKFSSKGPAVDFTEHQGIKPTRLNPGGTSQAAPAFTAVFILAQRYAKQLGLRYDTDSILKIIKETAKDGDVQPLAIQEHLEKQAKLPPEPTK
jgi:hypothetical protein